jgi:hypothetical protein
MRDVLLEMSADGQGVLARRVEREVPTITPN